MSSPWGVTYVLAFLLACAVLTAGCGQSDSPDGRVAGADGNPLDDSADPQTSAKLTPGQAAARDSGVELATGQSRVRPSRGGGESSAPLDDRPQPPARLPSADAPLPLDNVDTANLKMPKVNLTEHHKAICRVVVGDTFPDFELPDLEGDKQPLSAHFGDKLTLVVFWNGSQPIALQQLSDLARYHQPRFGDRGVAIVAINTGDDAQLVGELAKQAGAQFAVLSDADGSAFEQVASEKLPRTYLLDPSGTILWFDLEYSATTRRDMVEAIRFSLGQ